MGRRSIRLGLDIGVAHTRIVAVDGDTTEVVSARTLATGTSPLRPHEMPERLRRVAQLSEGSEITGRDDLMRRLRALLQEAAESGSFEAHDVETVILGTTWGTFPIPHSESPTVGLVIVGSPSSSQRLTAPSGDSFSDPIKLLSLRFDPEQVGYEAVLRNTLYDLRSRGARVLVVADENNDATSRREQEIVAASVALGLPALALHDMTAWRPTGGTDHAQNLLLRSLQVARFLPRLARLVDVAEKSLRVCDITAPLFIMGNDGTLLALDEFLRKPAWALFSGHVASIIGTLIEGGSEASSEEDAILLHIGGASTTVAPVRRGEPIKGSPLVEEVETGLPGVALQVVRVAGESLLRLHRGTIVGVGPRTAQDLGIPPAWMVPPEEIRSARLILDSDEYALLETSSGRRMALTVTCAAAVLGVSPGGDDGGEWKDEYTESARIACHHLGGRIALAPEDVAEMVLNRAADQLAKAVHALLRKNRLDRRTPVIASGAAAPLFIALLEENHGLKVRVAARPEYTGALGAARADLREKQPSAATPHPFVAPDQRVRLVAQAMMMEESQIELLAETDLFEVYAGTCRRRQLFGLWRGKQRRVVVCEKDGALRLRLGDAFVVSMTASEALPAIQSFLQWAAGENRAVPFPVLYLLRGRKILDLCHMPRQHQIMQMVEEELHGLPGDTPVILLAEKPGN